MTVVHLFDTSPILFQDLCIGMSQIELHLADGRSMNSAFAELMDKAMEYQFISFYGSQSRGVVICELIRGRGSSAQAILGLLNFIRLHQNLGPLNEWVIAEMAGVKGVYKSDEAGFEKWVTALAQCLIDTINHLCR